MGWELGMWGLEGLLHPTDAVIIIGMPMQGMTPLSQVMYKQNKKQPLPQRAYNQHVQEEPAGE